MQALTAFTRRKFVRDTLILQASKIGVTLLGLIAWAVVPVRMGTDAYGVWALAQSFFAIWLTFDLTGIHVSISTLLAVANGARDEDEILNLLAVHVKVTLLWALFSFAMLLLVGSPLASLIHGGNGDTRIGLLAAFLSLSLFFDPLYNLVLIVLQSRRLMGALALMQNVNQAVLTACLVTAALLNPTPETMVLARLTYSLLTLLLALLAYHRLRLKGDIPYPTIRAVLARAIPVSYRPYWRFGLATAVDKNVAGLYTQIPIQLVGAVGGEAASGYLQLALRGVQQAGVLTSAVFDNMQAVVPQAVGRGDYARLWRNFRRILLALTAGSIVFYGAFALLAPLVIVPLFGEEWFPALPLFPALAVYGVVTTVGGLLGPLYRAFQMMRQAIAVKIMALALMLPAGVLLVSQSPALGGAWMTNGLYALSIGLTAAAVLPALRKRALREE